MHVKQEQEHVTQRCAGVGIQLCLRQGSPASMKQPMALSFRVRALQCGVQARGSG